MLAPFFALRNFVPQAKQARRNYRTGSGSTILTSKSSQDFAYLAPPIVCFQGHTCIHRGARMLRLAAFYSCIHSGARMDIKGMQPATMREHLV